MKFHLFLFFLNIFSITFAEFLDFKDKKVSSRFWIEPENKSITSYIFAPGTFTCECRMALYLPKFISSTCEEVSFEHGIEVLKQPAIACNFKEIRFRSLKFSDLKPNVIYKKFLKKLTNIITNYCNSDYKISIKPQCLGKKESLKSQLTDISKINFGQEMDLMSFKNTYHQHLLDLKFDHPENELNLILYGFSRGAATIFNFVALHQPKEVKALICEGIFDTIENTLKDRFPYINVLMIKVLEKITHFKNFGHSPLSLAKQFPLDLPILLVTSYSDFIVPHKCVYNLYQELKRLGHQKVHILFLKKAGHLNYVLHNKEDREVHEQTVHAFYKKYNLPYIEELALKGQEIFENMQPS